MKRLVLEIWMRKFLRSSSGATAIEYAMIAAGISIMIVAGVTILGQGVNSHFMAVDSGF